MYSYISAKNLSGFPVVSVFVNDILYFRDLFSESDYKVCPAGSIQIIVLNNREKKIYDLYLPVTPRFRYALEILPEYCNFTPVGFS